MIGHTLVNFLQIFLTILFIYVLLLAASIGTWVVVRAIRTYLIEAELEKRVNSESPSSSKPAKQRYGSKQG